MFNFSMFRHNAFKRGCHEILTSSFFIIRTHLGTGQNIFEFSFDFTQIVEFSRNCAVRMTPRNHNRKVASLGFFFFFKLSDGISRPNQNRIWSFLACLSGAHLENRGRTFCDTLPLSLQFALPRHQSVDLQQCSHVLTHSLHYHRYTYCRGYFI